MSVIVCDSNGLDECCCCGGHATLGGTQEAIIGSRPSLRYCSVECHDEWEDHLAEQAEKRASCPECGYDQREHAPDCTCAPSPASTNPKEQP